jgi:hypothetical protein
MQLMLVLPALPSSALLDPPGRDSQEGVASCRGSERQNTNQAPPSQKSLCQGKITGVVGQLSLWQYLPDGECTVTQLSRTLATELHAQSCRLRSNTHITWSPL